LAGYAKCFYLMRSSSYAGLRENLAAAQLTLSPEKLAELDGIAAAIEAGKH
jgi:hypothetical protein